MSRQVALEYIRSLPAAQLATFIEEAVAHLSDGNLAVGLTVFRLAQCFTCNDSKGQFPETPTVRILASPTSPSEYAEHPYLDQAGTCSNCKAEVCCAAKSAVCPVCRTEVLCT